MQLKLKNLVEKLPVSVGRSLSLVPFTFRLGLSYQRMRQVIESSESADNAYRDAEYLAKLRSLIRFAAGHVEFYREFYRQQGFVAEDIQTLADWDNVPIVTKADLQSAHLDARCIKGAKGMKINTSGTSGQKLEFLIDNQAFAREWAHMHHLWFARGYRPQHVKLAFRDRYFDPAQALRYNSVHNEYIVNANSPMIQVVEAVLALQRSTVIRWLHGCPSVVAEFAHALSTQTPSVLSGFQSRLYGVLLRSEYPLPLYRSVIERVLSTNLVSWYGHSEMAILAHETAHGVYQSFPTYGYAEAIPLDAEPFRRLVCTSLHNRVHPFIRYDTGDLISSITGHDGSLVFQIGEGRASDFILDRQGKRHALMTFLFGRNHSAFDLVQHVQVRDEGQGRITLVVTPKNKDVNIVRLKQGFNLENLDIDWDLEIVNAPFRTLVGKIQLKLN